MKVLALDFGARRIGIAIADTEVGVASSRPFLTNDADVIENLSAICERSGIERIIIGLPRGLRGETEQTAAARDFAAELDQKFPVEIELVDERFTSKLASQNLQAAGEDSRKQKKLIDSEAARIILQEYLDSSLSQ
ncbi:MAG: Holliday junction resolvase RuvX [Patescibacteria group bacterium]